MDEVHLRRAKIEDAAQVQAIFAHYVYNSVATYQYDPPSVEFYEAKVEKSIESERFQFFVAAQSGKVLRYAYGSAYWEYPGYHYTIEDSIFIHHKQGLGKLLLGALIDECKRVKYSTMIAIFGSRREDLPGTFKLHESFGFVEVGRLKNVGYKFGRMLDTPILQLDLMSENA